MRWAEHGTDDSQGSSGAQENDRARRRSRGVRKAFAGRAMESMVALTLALNTALVIETGKQNLNTIHFGLWVFYA